MIKKDQMILICMEMFVLQVNAKTLPTVSRRHLKLSRNQSKTMMRKSSESGSELITLSKLMTWFLKELVILTNS